MYHLITFWIDLSHAETYFSALFLGKVHSEVHSSSIRITGWHSKVIFAERENYLEKKSQVFKTDVNIVSYFTYHKQPILCVILEERSYLNWWVLCKLEDIIGLCSPNSATSNLQHSFL